MHAIALCFVGLSTVVVSASLDCPTFPSREPPTVVTDLRPQDVRVVAAIGDSITAGFAMKGLPWEYRDESWSIGQGDATTLPNFIKHYNPAVTGGSTGNHLPELHGDAHHADDDHLNAAQSMALVGDVMTQQIPYLVKQLQSTPGVDMANDWKVLTVFIGANDLCDACFWANESAPIYQAKLDAVVAAIHADIPRCFVNLVQYMNLSRIYDLAEKDTYCAVVHSGISECDCVFRANAEQRAMMDTIKADYNQAMINVAAKYNLASPDFGVVVQPFLADTLIPDETYLSNLDCFHPSSTGHAALATNLWNSMLTPVGSKFKVANFTAVPTCPQADTLLYVK